MQKLKGIYILKIFICFLVFLIQLSYAQLNTEFNTKSIIDEFHFPNVTDSTAEYYIKALNQIDIGNLFVAERFVKKYLAEFDKPEEYIAVARKMEQFESYTPLIAARRLLEMGKKKYSDSDLFLYLGYIYELGYNKYKFRDLSIRHYRDFAISTYEEILEFDPNNIAAQYNLGRLYLEDAEEYKNSIESDYILPDHPLDVGITDLSKVHSRIPDWYLNQEARMKSGDAYRRMDDPKAEKELSNIIDEFKKEAMLKHDDTYQKSIDAATKYLTSVIKYNPEFNDIIQKVTSNYYISEQYQEAIDLLKSSKITKDESGLCKIKHLFLGLFYYKNGQLSLANEAFTTALGYMSKDELEDYFFNSIIPVMRDRIGEKFDSFDAELQRKYIQSYLAMDDPLYLTDYNERLLEHFFRVAYANLFFTVTIPERNLHLTGWSSERGDLFIRYGEPIEIIKLRAKQKDITEVYDETILWFYPNRVFAFVDVNRNGTFKLADANLGHSQAQYWGDSYAEYTMIKEVEPEKYKVKYGGPTIELPMNLVQFKNTNPKNLKTEIYLNYAVTYNDSIINSDKLTKSFTMGAFLVDNSLKSYYKKTEYVKESESFQFRRKDFSGYIHSHKLESEPVKANLSFEIIRSEDKGTFVNRGKLKVQDFSTGELLISDIFLAENIQFEGATDYPINRKGISILPSPTNMYSLDDPIFLYYEIYNLKKGENNLTNYTQQIEIIPVNEKGELGKVLENVLKAIGLQEEETVSINSNFESPNVDEQIFYKLDFSNYQSGKYLVRISITDNISGISNNREIYITRYSATVNYNND